MSHLFCRELLNQVRIDIWQNSIPVPKHITALRGSMGQYFVEADGVPGEWVNGDCAFEARANYLGMLVEREERARERLKA